MNIAAVPIGAVAIPFAIAAFPNLSEEAARGDRAAFIRTFASTFRQILFFLIPLSVLAMVLRLHIVRVIIGSQGLSWHETRLAAAAFGFFVASLVFQGLVPLLARAFYALKNTLIPVIVSIVSVTVNVTATYAGIWWLDASKGGGNAYMRIPLNLYGVDDVRVLALPLAFSLASVVQVVLLIIILRHRHGRIGGTGLLRAFLKFAAAAALCAFAAIQVLVRTESFIDLTRFKGVFLHAALATVAGLAAYFAVLKILHSEELDSFAGVFRRKMMRVEKPLPVQDAQEM
jgi:putative peptidoglycan lipid II flippase